MKVFRIAFFSLGCLLWPNLQSAQAAPPDAVSIGTATTMDVSSLPTEAVRVEIVEGVPDQTSWDFTPPPASESFTEPAFGFVVLPAKYSLKGVRVDRSSPFLFRASGSITLPKGEHRILLRARTGSRLVIDGQVLLMTQFQNLNADGHEEVPEAPVAVAPDIRYLRPGHLESLTNLISDGRSHLFTLEALVGTKGRRPELGELSVSFASVDGSFRLLSPSPAKKILLTEEGWSAYESERRAQIKARDRQLRQVAATGEEKYWAMRHDLARQQLGSAPEPALPKVSRSVQNEIDLFIGQKLESAQVTPAPLSDDDSFLRRVALDTIGLLPSPEQINTFRRDKSKSRRAHAIESLLNHPGWADHWVSYWQDVLAENPGILKPMLNNTGPFRWWIHESFLDNKPMDRFATELVLMEGSVYYGGPAGFSMATENDVPMAAKAQVVAKAFLGMEMQCARCHDAPFHHFKQKDLFSLAAMLKKEPQTVPLSSSIPTNSNIIIGRVVNVTLKPGSKVDPAWPLSEVMAEDIPPEVLRQANDPREKLAALLTDARNERFAKVMVNRIWKRYLGWGLVEPVDDWETAKPSHPELLAWLARQLVTHDYDLKHIARLILNSHTYQRQVTPAGSTEAKPEARLFASPARRRMTAEQVVDSMFMAVGKPFDSEEMNLDVDGRRPVKDFNNLGTPARAWEFASLSNERDRPALSMPKAQAIVDTLCAFGWRESRQNPLTVRDQSPNVLQPAIIANGLMGNGRVTRLSEDSAITALCLEDHPLPDLIRSVFLRVLSRPPTPDETKMFSAHLEKGYAGRLVEPSASRAFKTSASRRPVSWSNHLNPEATRIKQEMEREVRAGDPVTERLRPEWRERMEDMLWALLNSPEFVFVP
jgi:Protein of unknown function (DUF1553)/Protein of unknown function (DUF1549)